jgi:hypothetical protein
MPVGTALNAWTLLTPVATVECQMAQKEICSRPSNVSAEDGVVNVDGPDGVDVGLTPEAALETSDRLLHGAATAVGQRVQAKHAKEDSKPV